MDQYKYEGHPINSKIFFIIRLCINFAYINITLAWHILWRAQHNITDTYSTDDFLLLSNERKQGKCPRSGF